MRYLVLGISFFVIACGKKTIEPPIKTATYIYVNKLNSQISIETYGLEGKYETKIVNSGDSIIYVSRNEAVYPFISSTGVPGGYADSVEIKFEDDKCIGYKYYGYLATEQKLSAGGV